MIRGEPVRLMGATGAAGGGNDEPQPAQFTDAGLVGKRRAEHFVVPIYVGPRPVSQLCESILIMASTPTPDKRP